MRSIRIELSVLAVLLLLSSAGCGGRGPQPVGVSHAALGTIVKIEAYGDDKAALSSAVNEAFAAITLVEVQLNAYSETSTIAAFNAAPFEWHTLPADAVEILDAIDRLDVAGEFSPALFGVMRLYDFGGANRVPLPGQLGGALHTASMPERDGDRMRFLPITSSYAVPGLDFGGAAKGLALDRARESLRSSGVVTAALVTAGSTTVTLGTKPDGEAWRVGVEDPRVADTVRVVASWTGDGALSTSGDYQQYFERGGVRYHHILDPKTGLPARGTQSLTVVGRVSGLDSDILSTALFVGGPDGALAYVREHALGAYIIDGEGRTHLAPAPAESGMSLTEGNGE